eukprot:2077337-Pyramimonas_sp.AAC.1
MRTENVSTSRPGQSIYQSASQSAAPVRACTGPPANQPLRSEHIPVRQSISRSGQNIYRSVIFPAGGNGPARLLLSFGLLCEFHTKRLRHCPLTYANRVRLRLLENSRVISEGVNITHRSFCLNWSSASSEEMSTSRASGSHASVPWRPCLWLALHSASHDNVLF